jgi:hypothetical protein
LSQTPSPFETFVIEPDLEALSAVNVGQDVGITKAILIPIQSRKKCDDSAFAVRRVSEPAESAPSYPHWARDHHRDAGPDWPPI